MKAKGLPRRIYVQVDENSDGSNDEDLLAWRSLSATDEGRIGTYELVEEVDRRQVVEVRRKGTTKWFKPESR